MMLLALLLAHQVTTQTPKTTVILERPVVVTAVVRRMGKTEFESDVQIGAHHRVTSDWIAIEGGIGEVIELIRSTTQFRGRLLFVRHECGGGNGWSCNTEHVFRIESYDVTKIGEFIVGEDRIAAQSLHGRYIFDIYDKLEDWPLPMAHAGRPRFQIALAISNGRVHGVDLAETWNLNQDKVNSL